MPRAAARPSGRGGRRPGAGAPKGNMNALRSGSRSKQLKAVVFALMAVPQTRRVLLHFSRLEQRRRDALRDAMNEYARLLQLPSRERSIKAARKDQLPEDVRFLETIIRDLPPTTRAPVRPSQCPPVAERNP